MTLEQLGTKKSKIMYFVQYFDDITMSWKEIRKTYKTEQEAKNVAFSYGDARPLRVVTYIDGNRTYEEVTNN